MKTPNIDKAKAVLCTLTNFPESVLTPNEKLWMKVIIEHDLALNEAKRIIGDLVSLAEGAMQSANRDGAEYDIKAELKEAREFLGEVTPTDHCATGSGAGGSKA